MDVESNSEQNETDCDVLEIHIRYKEQYVRMRKDKDGSWNTWSNLKRPKKKKTSDKCF